MINVRLEDVEVKYPRSGDSALQVANLDLAAGAILAVVGVSGSGKSTLLRTVAGFIRARMNPRRGLGLINQLILPRGYAPLTGTVYFDGKDVSNLSPRSRRIAFATQALNLYPNMTAYENMAFPLRMAGTNATEVQRRVEGIASKLELGRLLHRRPSEISGGEQQRVALGKALVQDANVYLFDEPLSSIDAPLRAVFRKDLRTWLRDPRRTTFYVTHDMDEAFTIADQVAVLHQGKLLQISSPHELYRSPKSLTVAKLVWGGRTTVLPGVIDRSNGRPRIRVGSETINFTVPKLDGFSSQVWIAGPREAFAINTGLPDGSSALSGMVTDIRFAASSYLVDIKGTGFSIEVAVNGADLPSVGSPIRICINPNLLRLFPNDPLFPEGSTQALEMLKI